jgi:hypothetical protein
LPSSADSERWQAVPVALIRHAGYPLDDVTALADPALAGAAADLLTAWRAARSAGAAVPRSARGDGGAFGSLRPVAGDGPGLAAYRAAVAEFDARLARFAGAHAEALAAGRAHVARLFTDPWRQQVLLLANPSIHQQVRDWLADRAPTTARTRKLTDLLAMYVQRLATKNETNSHFGPFAVARFTGDVAGVAWTERGAPARVAFLAHWAGQRLLDGLTAERLPRPHPLAFPTGRGPVRYDYVDGDGLPYPWVLTGPGEPPADPRLHRLFDLVDGERTVVRLRELSPGVDVDSGLAALEAAGLVITRPELPSGEADAVAGLRAADPALAGRLQRLLDEFAGGTPARRVELLAELTGEFERRTEEHATRGAGQIYADRTVLFEDAISPMRDVRVGREIERFVTSELAEVYGGVLFPSRLRADRERAVLGDWLTDAFGPGRDVPLAEVYQRHRADRERLATACDTVDKEVADARVALTGALLAGWDGVAAEVAVPPGTLRALVDGVVTGQPAVCNPDVMLAAASPDAVARGDFVGVVGDCHAVRDLLTHGPFAPLLRTWVPDVAAHVLDGYRRVIDEDEVLVDVVRAHRSKIAAQWALPVPHLEVAGRSPHPRADVVLPKDLRLRVTPGGTPALVSPRFPGRRVRLMASISGADSVRFDPVAPFAFPRSLGGGLLDAVDRPYLPRLRSGRVVLSRRRWRVPVADLDPWRPHRRFPTQDARQFASAILLAENLALPRHCFATFPHEPKPVYVDWHAPLLVRQFHRLAHTTPAGAAITLTEMLPIPTDSWLILGGGRHTAELRCTLFSR